jgi:hypothetical protein
MVNFTGGFNMSEQMAEQTSAEPGSLKAALGSLETPGTPFAVPAKESVPETTNVDSPKLSPEQGGAGETRKVDTVKADAPKADAPKADAAKAEAAKADAAKAEAAKAEAAKAEAAKAEAPKAEAAKADAPKADAPKSDARRMPGTIMIMSAGDRAGSAPQAEQGAGMFGKRRLAALAAVVALAAMAGALGGALATAGVGHFTGDGATTSANTALEASVARIDADIQGLKANLEHISKTDMAQLNKTGDRLDKVEKAQAEPAAKLAKLSEAVDKLRVAPAAAPVAAAAAKEVTGSISPPVAAPKVEVARLPTVEGWLLHDVADGGALIEGRQGVFEVYAGDPVPGLGRVEAIRRQDGRWVVVTTRGLIVAR